MTQPARTTRGAVESLVGAVVFSALWAMLLNLVLQLFHGIYSGSDIKFIFGLVYLRAGIFLLSAGLIWLIVLVVLAVTGRLWVTCAVTLGAAILFGAVDHTKVQLRQEPIYPSDVDFLRSPQFLVSMVGWPMLVAAVLGLAVLVAGVILLGRIPARTFNPIRRQHTPRIWWGVMVARVAAVGLAVLVLVYAGGFNVPGNKVRAAYEAAGARWAFWYQTLNYEENTVVGGLLYNLNAPVMAQPKDYSQATMAEITRRYEGVAAQLNKGRSGSIDDVNIVVILSEAFSDPTRVKGATVHGDPIPRTRALMRTTTSGDMLAQLLGGGTANMEFETLSGQSLALFDPQLNTPYQQFVYKQKHFPTVVGYLRQHGHDVIAVHPYITAMYRRSQVYQSFGIQKFIHDTTMAEHSKLGKSQFIDDKSAFDEVERQVAKHTKPLFVNLVTMQNHWPMAGWYKNPWPVSGVHGATKNELSGYSRGINYTDDALAKFLAHLQKSPEKTAVVFYGDHLPAFWTESLQRKNTLRTMRSTPYFVWTNFNHTKLKTAPLTSPTQFMPMVFDQADAPLPPYYALLTRLRQQIPAMEQDQRYGPTGTRLEGTLSPAAAQVLHDYRLVQYDLSVGKRYSQAGLFYPNP